MNNKQLASEVIRIGQWQPDGRQQTLYLVASPGPLSLSPADAPECRLPPGPPSPPLSVAQTSTSQITVREKKEEKRKTDRTIVIGIRNKQGYIGLHSPHTTVVGEWNKKFELIKMKEQLLAQPTGITITEEWDKQGSIVFAQPIHTTVIGEWKEGPTGHGHKTHPKKCDHSLPLKETSLDHLSLTLTHHTPPQGPYQGSRSMSGDSTSHL